MLGDISDKPCLRAFARVVSPMRVQFCLLFWGCSEIVGKACLPRAKEQRRRWDIFGWHEKTFLQPENTVCWHQMVLWYELETSSSSPSCAIRRKNRGLSLTFQAR